MSDDTQYSSRADTKRKFDDTPSPVASGGPTRRATGFSPAITSPSSGDSPAAPGSYNSVPPPLDEIQLAKQKAQEIAARLFSSAEAKRPRVENGANDVLDQKPPGMSMGLGFSMPPSIGSYGFQGSSKKIDIPNGRVGVIIGKGGETIKYLQLQSGAKIQVTRDMDADPNAPTRVVELMGTPEQISKAEQLINDVLSEAEVGGSGIVTSRRVGPSQGSEQFSMKVPNNKVGLIIGKGGETIKSIQGRSGARVQLIPLHLPPGDPATDRTVHMEGTKEQIETAKQLVNEIVNDQSRARNQSMGGYNQQVFRPPRPPTAWAPPGPPIQQPGYGYMQPGTYPGAPPAYNVSQPPYNNYPPQQATSGFSPGWDQTQGAAAQQAPQSGGYDYYGQQQQPQQQQEQQPGSGGSSAPTDNTAYGYGQPPQGSYGQQPPYDQSSYPQSTAQPPSYGQDGGYGSYPSQASYAQPPEAGTQVSYDQQQGYGTAPSYGTQAPDGSAPAAYGSQATAPGQPTQQTPAAVGQPPVSGATQAYSQAPAAATSYPSQTTQAGYGVAPTSQPGYGSQSMTQPAYGAQPSYSQQPAAGQKPPGQMAYGQAPTSQGGYPQAYVQPGAAPAAYSQSDPNSRTTPASYGGTQAAYGQQPYGASAPGQTGYAQQQYGGADSYNAYAQPSAYSGDINASGNVHSGYEAPPGAPAAVKTDPQS